MGKSVACRDLGSNCDYIVSGETDDEVIEGMKKHGIDVHKMTEEQVNSPEMLKLTKEAIITG
jgi:predicted small metal-binding protein